MYANKTPDDIENQNSNYYKGFKETVHLSKVHCREILKSHQALIKTNLEVESTFYLM